MRSILLITTLLLASIPVYSQFYLFGDTGNSGLRNNRIRDIESDRSGTKYFYTRNGLYRLKRAADWTTFNVTNSGLPSNFGNCLFVDSNHVWAGSNNGVGHYNGSTWVTYNTSNSNIPHNEIVGIRKDLNGKIWVATNSNFVASFNGSTWTKYDLRAILGSTYTWFTCVEVDKFNNIWFGTPNNGFVKYNGTTWRKYTVATDSIIDNGIIAMKADKDGNLWVVGPNGMSKLSLNGDILNIRPMGNQGFGMNDIDIDDYDRIWVSTDGRGLGMYDNGTWTFINTSNELRNDNLTCVENDSFDDIMWFGTDNDGYINTNIPSSIQEREAGFMVTVYPNPASEYMTLLNAKNINSVEIVDLAGRQIGTLQVEQPSGRICIDNIPAGQYLLYSSDNSFVTAKLTIVR